MKLYNKFKEKGYELEIYYPDKPKDILEWIIKIYKKNKIIKENHLDMNYPPMFGVDEFDKINLEKNIEELLNSLP